MLTFLKKLLGLENSSTSSYVPTHAQSKLVHTRVTSSEIATLQAYPRSKEVNELVYGTFATDIATFVAFDPEAFNHLKDKTEWWLEYDSHLVPEVEQGKLTLISLQADGGYRFRFTPVDALTPLEKEYCVHINEGLGVEVTTNKLYLGDGIHLPDWGNSVNIEDIHDGILVDIPNGSYNLKIYTINPFEAKSGPEQEGGEDLPDFVVVIGKRSDPFVPSPDLYLNQDNTTRVFKS